MKIAQIILQKKYPIFLVDHVMGLAAFYIQKSKSHEEFFYLVSKAGNTLPQTLRASQTVQSFSSINKDTLMECLTNDEHYQINNFFTNSI